MTSKWLKVATTAGLAVVLLACATSPTGRNVVYMVSEGQMSQMGAQAYDEIKQQEPIDRRRSVNRYVNCVADALIAQLDETQAWEVTVFKNDAANAFALPGGKIGVYNGMLKVAKTQSQLAAVMGHEVKHVLARHGNERVSTSQLVGLSVNVLAILAGEAGVADQRQAMALLGLGAQVGVLLPFSRAQETEADVLGLDLMARAGFDPREAVRLWENMAAESGGKQPAEFASTHPSHDTRINDLQKRMPYAMQLYEQARAEGRRPRCK